ncbi:uncharacterized protein LOC131957864 [Physella acuta]|uniref:uncharacterized protein LOC131957864 n=1 Tax=Physella acuta TaxID=109671 RepID=UPI0027DB77E0|nr:uncharacterized protein LOC131957864 [Physella acuta]
MTSLVRQPAGTTNMPNRSSNHRSSHELSDEQNSTYYDLADDDPRGSRHNRSTHCNPGSKQNKGSKRLKTSASPVPGIEPYTLVILPGYNTKAAGRQDEGSHNPAARSREKGAGVAAPRTIDSQPSSSSAQYDSDGSCTKFHSATAIGQSKPHIAAGQSKVRSSTNIGQSKPRNVNSTGQGKAQSGTAIGQSRPKSGDSTGQCKTESAVKGMSQCRPNSGGAVSQCNSHCKSSSSYLETGTNKRPWRYEKSRSNDKDPSYRPSFDTIVSPRYKNGLTQRPFSEASEKDVTHKPRPFSEASEKDLSRKLRPFSEASEKDLTRKPRSRSKEYSWVSHFRPPSYDDMKISLDPKLSRRSRSSEAPSLKDLYGSETTVYESRKGSPLDAMFERQARPRNTNCTVKTDGTSCTTSTATSSNSKQVKPRLRSETDLEFENFPDPTPGTHGDDDRSGINHAGNAVVPAVEDISDTIYCKERTGRGAGSATVYVSKTKQIYNVGSRSRKTSPQKDRPLFSARILNSVYDSKNKSHYLHKKPHRNRPLVSILTSTSGGRRMHQRKHSAHASACEKQCANSLTSETSYTLNDGEVSQEDVQVCQAETSLCQGSPKMAVYTVNIPLDVPGKKKVKGTGGERRTTEIIEIGSDLITVKEPEVCRPHRRRCRWQGEEGEKHSASTSTQNSHSRSKRRRHKYGNFGWRQVSEYSRAKGSNCYRLEGTSDTLTLSNKSSHAEKPSIYEASRAKQPSNRVKSSANGGSARSRSRPVDQGGESRKTVEECGTTGNYSPRLKYASKPQGKGIRTPSLTRQHERKEGLDSQVHHEALSNCIKEGERNSMVKDRAISDVGSRLTYDTGHRKSEPCSRSSGSLEKEPPTKHTCAESNDGASRAADSHYSRHCESRESRGNTVSEDRGSKPSQNARNLLQCIEFQEPRDDRKCSQAQDSGLGSQQQPSTAEQSRRREGNLHQPSSSRAECEKTMIEEDKRDVSSRVGSKGKGQQTGRQGKPALHENKPTTSEQCRNKPTNPEDDERRESEFKSAETNMHRVATRESPRSFSSRSSSANSASGAYPRAMSGQPTGQTSPANTRRHCSSNTDIPAKNVTNKRNEECQNEPKVYRSAQVGPRESGTKLRSRSRNIESSTVGDDFKSVHRTASVHSITSSSEKLKARSNNPQERPSLVHEEEAMDTKDVQVQARTVREKGSCRKLSGRYSKVTSLSNHMLTKIEEERNIGEDEACGQADQWQKNKESDETRHVDTHSSENYNTENTRSAWSSSQTKTMKEQETQYSDSLQKTDRMTCTSSKYDGNIFKPEKRSLVYDQRVFNKEALETGRMFFWESGKLYKLPFKCEKDKSAKTSRRCLTRDDAQQMPVRKSCAEKEESKYPLDTARKYGDEIGSQCIMREVSRTVGKKLDPGPYTDDCLYSVKDKRQKYVPHRSLDDDCSWDDRSLPKSSRCAEVTSMSRSKCDLKPKREQRRVYEDEACTSEEHQGERASSPWRSTRQNPIAMSRTVECADFLNREKLPVKISLSCLRQEDSRRSKKAPNDVIALSSYYAKDTARAYKSGSGAIPRSKHRSGEIPGSYSDPDGLAGEGDSDDLTEINQKRTQSRLKNTFCPDYTSQLSKGDLPSRRHRTISSYSCDNIQTDLFKPPRHKDRTARVYARNTDNPCSRQSLSNPVLHGTLPDRRSWTTPLGEEEEACTEQFSRRASRTSPDCVSPSRHKLASRSVEQSLTARKPPMSDTQRFLSDEDYESSRQESSESQNVRAWKSSDKELRPKSFTSRVACKEIPDSIRRRTKDSREFRTFSSSLAENEPVRVDTSRLKTRTGSHLAGQSLSARNLSTQKTGLVKELAVDKDGLYEVRSPQGYATQALNDQCAEVFTAQAASLGDITQKHASQNTVIILKDSNVQTETGSAQNFTSRLNSSDKMGPSLKPSGQDKLQEISSRVGDLSKMDSTPYHSKPGFHGDGSQIVSDYVRGVSAIDKSKENLKKSIRPDESIRRMEAGAPRSRTPSNEAIAYGRREEPSKIVDDSLSTRSSYKNSQSKLPSEGCLESTNRPKDTYLKSSTVGFSKADDGLFQERLRAPTDSKFNSTTGLKSRQSLNSAENPERTQIKDCGCKNKKPERTSPLASYTTRCAQLKSDGSGLNSQNNSEGSENDARKPTSDYRSSEDCPRAVGSRSPTSVHHPHRELFSLNDCYFPRGTSRYSTADMYGAVGDVGAKKKRKGKESRSKTKVNSPSPQQGDAPSSQRSDAGKSFGVPKEKRTSPGLYPSSSRTKTTSPGGMSRGDMRAPSPRRPMSNANFNQDNLNPKGTVVYQMSARYVTTNGLRVAGGVRVILDAIQRLGYVQMISPLNEVYVTHYIHTITYLSSTSAAGVAWSAIVYKPTSDKDQKGSKQSKGKDESAQDKVDVAQVVFCDPYQAHRFRIVLDTVRCAFHNIDCVSSATANTLLGTGQCASCPPNFPTAMIDPLAADKFTQSCCSSPRFTPWPIVGGFVPCPAPGVPINAPAPMMSRPPCDAGPSGYSCGMNNSQRSSQPPPCSSPTKNMGCAINADLVYDPYAYENAIEKTLFSSVACLVRLSKDRTWLEMQQGFVKVTQCSNGMGFSLVFESGCRAGCTHHYIRRDTIFERAPRTQHGFIYNTICSGEKGTVVDEFLISFQTKAEADNFKCVVDKCHNLLMMTAAKPLDCNTCGYPALYNTSWSNSCGNNNCSCDVPACPWGVGETSASLRVDEESEQDVIDWNDNNHNPKQPVINGYLNPNVYCDRLIFNPTLSSAISGNGKSRRYFNTALVTLLKIRNERLLTHPTRSDKNSLNFLDNSTIHTPYVCRMLKRLKSS